MDTLAILDVRRRRQAHNVAQPHSQVVANDAVHAHLLIGDSFVRQYDARCLFALLAFQENRVAAEELQEGGIRGLPFQPRLYVSQHESGLSQHFYSSKRSGKYLQLVHFLLRDGNHRVVIVHGLLDHQAVWAILVLQDGRGQIVIAVIETFLDVTNFERLQRYVLAGFWTTFLGAMRI